MISINTFDGRAGVLVQKIKFAKMFWAISIFLLGAGVLLCTLSFVLSESHYEMFWEGYARQLNISLELSTDSARSEQSSRAK